MWISRLRRSYWSRLWPHWFSSTASRILVLTQPSSCVFVWNRRILISRWQTSSSGDEDLILTSNHSVSWRRGLSNWARLLVPTPGFIPLTRVINSSSLNLMCFCFVFVFFFFFRTRRFSQRMWWLQDVCTEKGSSSCTTFSRLDRNASLFVRSQRFFSPNCSANKAGRRVETD